MNIWDLFKCVYFDILNIDLEQLLGFFFTYVYLPVSQMWLKWEYLRLQRFKISRIHTKSVHLVKKIVVQN